MTDQLNHNFNRISTSLRRDCYRVRLMTTPFRSLELNFPFVFSPNAKFMTNGNGKQRKE